MQDDLKKEGSKEESFTGRNEEVQKKIEELAQNTRDVVDHSVFPEPPEWRFKRKPTQHERQTFSNQERTTKGLAVGLMASYGLIGPILLGWMIGYFFDCTYGGNAGQTIGVLVGMPLGIMGIIYMLSKYNNDDKK